MRYYVNGSELFHIKNFIYGLATKQKQEFAPSRCREKHSDFSRESVKSPDSFEHEYLWNQ